jgi:hypothetical protein
MRERESTLKRLSLNSANYAEAPIKAPLIHAEAPIHTYRVYKNLPIRSETRRFIGSPSATFDAVFRSVKPSREGGLLLRHTGQGIIRQAPPEACPLHSLTSAIHRVNDSMPIKLQEVPAIKASNRILGDSS